MVNIENKKLSLNSLTIEITRRCQLKRAHCMRGDAQDLDMSFEIIDKLLEQVVSIDRLLFTGGEPTLNTAGMRYFLDRMIENKISLGKLEIITNGVMLNAEVTDLIKAYYTWISDGGSEYSKYILFGISDDKYHIGANTDCALAFYQDQFKDYTKIYVYRHKSGGLLPEAKGRGKKLAEAIDFGDNYIEKYYLNRRIETMEYGKPCFCVYRKYEKLRSTDEILVLCGIQISAKGNIVNEYVSEYALEDGAEFHDSNILSNDLLTAIEKYNVGRPYCIDNLLAQEKLRSTSIIDGIIQDVSEMLTMPFKAKEIVNANFSLIERSSEYIEYATDVAEESESEEYPIDQADFQAVYNDLHTFLENCDKEYYSTHPGEKVIHDMIPRLSRKDCMYIVNSIKLYDRYKNDTSPNAQVVAKTCLNMIEEILNKERSNRRKEFVDDLKLLVSETMFNGGK